MCTPTVSMPERSLWTRMRIPLLVFWVLVVVTAACGNADDVLNGGGGSGGQATATVRMHDAPPAPNVAEVILTIDDLALLRHGASPVDVLDSPVTLDVLGALAANPFDLATDSVPDGSYTGVRLSISDAVLKFNDGTPDADVILGNPVVASVAAPFTVIDGGTVTITLDFNAETSIIPSGSDFLLDANITVDAVQVTP
jgi:Domain of unknown function (DUF4382)